MLHLTNLTWSEFIVQVVIPQPSRGGSHKALQTVIFVYKYCSKRLKPFCTFLNLLLVETVALVSKGLHITYPALHHHNSTVMLMLFHVSCSCPSPYNDVILLRTHTCVPTVCLCLRLERAATLNDKPPPVLCHKNNS